VGLIIFALFSVILSKYKFIVNDILRLKKTMCFFLFIVLEFYIGRRYADERPANWHIPHYLFVAGIV
jgi:hypothetical protein